MQAGAITVPVTLLLSEAAIDAIAAAVWAKTLPLGAAPVVSYGSAILSSDERDAIAHAVWAKTLP